MWQQLSAHGLQRFSNANQVGARQKELERALSELCNAIAKETGNKKLSGLNRARALRSRPATGGKSHYECLNQLIHYWYCCAAAAYLLRRGFTQLRIRPTGHDNANDLGDDESNGTPYDIRARHKRFGRIVGEVFCVSKALWPQKMAKTRTKLANSKAALRAVFYNMESKPAYKPKMSGLIVFGVRESKYDVVQLASTTKSWDKMLNSGRKRLNSHVA